MQKFKANVRRGDEEKLLWPRGISVCLHDETLCLSISLGFSVADVTSSEATRSKAIQRNEKG